MREAVWLTSEEVENAVARHEGYVLSQEFFRRAKLQTALVLVAAATLVAVVAFTAATTAFFPAFLFAVAGLSLGAIPLARHWELRQEARREPDLALQEGFGKGPGQFVELIVRQGDAPTGVDRGMLWIEDGRLYFSGHRTSFGLVPSQIDRFATQGTLLPGVRNEFDVQLRRETPVGPLSVSLGVLVPPNGSVRYAQRQLAGLLGEWRGEPTLEEGQWPPLSLGPGVVSERRLLLEAVAYGFPIPLVLILFALASHSFLPLAAALPYGAFCVGNDFARLRWRALRDRRRLRGRR